VSRYVLSSDQESVQSCVGAILTALNDAMEAACITVMGLGWWPSDCVIEHDAPSLYRTLVVRGRRVFEVGHSFKGEVCTVESRWLAAPLPCPTPWWS